MSYLTNEENQTTGFLDQVVQSKGEQWKDPEVLAKGYAKSQEYIEDLERQLSEAREDINAGKKIEDILAQLSQAQTPPAKEPDSNSGVNSSETTKAVDENQIKALIEQTITDKERQSTRRSNLETAEAELEKRFGTEVESEMNKRAAELNMSREQLVNLAGESPSAFLMLIGTPMEAPKPVTRGSVNTVAGLQETSGKRNDAFYRKLRRENPTLYHSAKIQQQRFNDRLEQGEAFYSS